MSAEGVERLFIEHIASHLPKGKAALQVVDVDGRIWELIGELRPKLQITVQPAQSAEWGVRQASVDAVVVYDTHLEETVLQAALQALRPGGRLIVMLSSGRPDERYVRTLQESGYTRIVAAIGAEVDGQAIGVLIRGEKPQPETRPNDESGLRASNPNLDTTRGRRYVYLLVQQTPNKPLAKLRRGEAHTWYGAGIENNRDDRHEQILLVFSNLTRAVEFMQPAIVDGYMQEVNQIAKFAWETVRAWPMPVILNPSDEILRTNPVVWMTIDPSKAEKPD